MSEAATLEPETLVDQEPRHRRDPASATPVVGAEELPAAVEAILLTLERPVTPAKIGEALRLPSDDVSPAIQVERAIDALNEVYESTGRAFRIERVAGGYRVMTRPEQAEAVAAFQSARAGAKLSRAAVETLAIIAYRQPITRAELEGIRGVACGEVLRTLLEKRLIAIAGRAEEVGRPMLYGTSKRFLEEFGLASLKDLPKVEELMQRAAGRGSSADSEPAPESTSKPPEEPSPAEDDDAGDG